MRKTARQKAIERWLAKEIRLRLSKYDGQKVTPEIIERIKDECEQECKARWLDE